MGTLSHRKTIMAVLEGPVGCFGGSREGFCEEAMRRISHVKTGGKSIQGSWNSMCKGPEAGTS